jgi:hypothetical protein
VSNSCESTASLKLLEGKVFPGIATLHDLEEGHYGLGHQISTSPVPGEVVISSETGPRFREWLKKYKAAHRIPTVDNFFRKQEADREALEERYIDDQKNLGIEAEKAFGLL